MIDTTDTFGHAADGSPIPGSIRRSAKARRISLFVYADRVELVIPEGAALIGPQGALTFLKSKRAWIGRTWDRIRKKAQAREAAREPAPCFQHGSTVLHRGERLHLSVLETDVRRPRVAEMGTGKMGTDTDFPGGKSVSVPIFPEPVPIFPGLHVSVPRGLTDLGRERAVAVAVRAWAWAGLLAEARRHAEELAARLGMPVTDVRLTRARSRWGSCSSTGVIRINVALAAAPPDLLEYLVAHEVAHLRWRGHGPRFYAALTRLLPDWQDRRARLRIFEREHPDLLRGPNGIPSPT
jgi:predicted metal-dependent hydrolase